jgi:hypothetical protein
MIESLIRLSFLLLLDKLGLTFFWSMIFPEDDVDATRPPLKVDGFRDKIFLT